MFSKKPKWTPQSIPDLTGKIAVVTGANSGLGYETTLELARHHCKVIMACRDPKKAESAKEEIIKRVPTADLEIEQLDLANFSSIENFCERMKTHPKLSILVNNAGVSGIPYSLTKDKFEITFQTNYLGPFILTAKLIPLLCKDGNARIVEVSSFIHKIGKIEFDNLQGEKNYNSVKAYFNTKLAGLLFSFELDRRIRAAGLSIASVAAHPGYANTNIMSGESSLAYRFAFSIGNHTVSQSAAKGALPILFAATSERVKGGEYYGPDGFMGLSGNPKLAEASTCARNTELAKKLWEVSEGLMKFKFDLETKTLPASVQNDEPANTRHQIMKRMKKN